jgi:hypothetical protein
VIPRYKTELDLPNKEGQKKKKTTRIIRKVVKLIH